MKIVLVQSPAWAVESPSYALALLSAVLKGHGHEVKCFDINIDVFQYCQDKDEAESWCMDDRGNCWYDGAYVKRFMDKYHSYIQKLVSMILAEGTQVIGFSVKSTTRHFSVELARRIKEKDNSRIIIFGGAQCFKNCEGIGVLNNPWIDAVCYGEGENALVDFLERLSKNKSTGHCPGFAYRDPSGQIVECEEAKTVTDLNMLPFADFSDFDLSRYTKILLPILTSRGCTHRCTFCSESPHWRRYRYRTAENIYQEMLFQLKKYPHINEFWFNDSLINGHIMGLESLCDLLIRNKSGVKWGGQAYVRPEMAPELLKKMKKAGCKTISYGVENGSDRILRLMRKGYTSELAERVIRDTFRAGIYTIFNIIAGYPGETEDDFIETREFLIRNVQYANEIALSPLLLLKGSYIYDHAGELGICLPEADAQLCWYTRDGGNTYEVRLKRLEAYKEIVHGKACCTRSESDTHIEVGDLMLQKGEFQKALDSYIKAKELNSDPNKVNTIEERIMYAKGRV